MKRLLLTLFLLVFPSAIYADGIALTFDDLPLPQDEWPVSDQRAINELILLALKEFNAPAIGFVNEGKLYKKGQTNEKIAILQLWIDNGHLLGNHTYSHKSLSNVKVEEFQKDVLEGEKISKKLLANAGMSLRYFRHPYLDTGATKEARDSFESFLKREGYVIAPVTIDTDDWKFNRELRKHPDKKHTIIAKYLEHTKLKFAFYKRASEKIFGRNIKHIWLLHCNQINAYAMRDLLKIAQNYGYQFIPLDDALTDPAYKEPDNFYASSGVSWLYRWDFTRGKMVNWSQDPEPTL